MEYAVAVGSIVLMFLGLFLIMHAAMRSMVGEEDLTAEVEQFLVEQHL